MRVFIGKYSALEFWQSAWSDSVASNHPSRVRSLRFAANNAKQVQEFALERFGFRERSIDILVNESAKRCESASHTVHLWTGPLADGSFFEIGNNVYVSSPPFTLLQIAPACDMVELVKIGYELCSDYRLDDIDPRGFVSVDRRTDLQKLEKYFGKMQGCKGVKASRQSTRWIADGSASPAETTLAMLLTLPARFGGCGFPKPMLNHRIELDAEASRMIAKQYLKCDLFWPDYNVAIEYDSDMFHTGSERIAEDSIRRNVLGYLGITVITVTRRQLYSTNGMSAVAQQLAKAMRKKPYGTRADTTAFQQLKSRLLFG